jgi:hypothetical protein
VGGICLPRREHLPYFTPDSEYYQIGRPYKTWWCPLVNEPYFLCFASKHAEPVKLFSPFQEELDEFEFAFDSGRENFVSYELVRQMNLTAYGRVFYRDDYDVMFDDEYIARLNKPFDRAEIPEPIWPIRESNVSDNE